MALYSVLILYRIHLRKPPCATQQSARRLTLKWNLLARYMERLMQGEAAAKDHGGITEELLHKSGFFG